MPGANGPMLLQSRYTLLATGKNFLHAAPAEKTSQCTDNLPPYLLAERSRELRTQSRLLVWRAQRLRAHSRVLRDRLSDLLSLSGAWLHKKQVQVKANRSKAFMRYRGYSCCEERRDTMHYCVPCWLGSIVTVVCGVTLESLDRCGTLPLAAVRRWACAAASG
jgi:hypothetical protein